MKKLIVLILSIYMLFSFTACGANNDENNKIMQAKIDEEINLANELCDYYEANGFLEGDYAPIMQPIVDGVKATNDKIQEAHQEHLDSGGYDDEKLKVMVEAADVAITGFKESLEEIKRIREIDILKDKYNEIFQVARETASIAIENGWENDEELILKVNDISVFMNTLRVNFEDPAVMTSEYKEELSALAVELLPIWQKLLVQVSEPYVAE